MVNLLPCIKDGDVTWTTMRVEGQQYIVEGYRFIVTGIEPYTGYTEYLCVNVTNPNEYFWSGYSGCAVYLPEVTVTPDEDEDEEGDGADNNVCYCDECGALLIRCGASCMFPTCPNYSSTNTSGSSSGSGSGAGSNGGGNSGGGSGGGSTGGTGGTTGSDPSGSTGDGDTTSQKPSDVAPLATNIFQNETLTLDKWKLIESALENITSNNNCFGLALYNAYLTYINLTGGKMSIEIGDHHGFNTNSTSPRIILKDGFQGHTLFHEMFHGFQYRKEVSNEAFENSVLNQEIECWYARHWYVKSSGYVWENQNNIDEAMIYLEAFVDGKGNTPTNYLWDMIMSAYINAYVQGVFRKYSAYKDYKFDLTRSNYVNYKNVRELFKDCD